MKLIIITTLMLAYTGWTAFIGSGQEQGDPLKESMKRGAEVYDSFCVNCHMADGKGVEDAFPPLAKADFLLKKREESILAVKNGLSGEIKVNGETYNSVMADQGLYDDEVADVMNYILNSWGNKSDKMVTEKEVKSLVEQKKKEAEAN